MNASDLRTKTEDELKTELMALRKEQFNLRFQKSGGQLENTARVRVVRRDIARIKTVLNEPPQEANKVKSSKEKTKPKTTKKTTKTSS